MKKDCSMELVALANQFCSKGSSSFRDNKEEFSKGKEKVSDSKGKLAEPQDKEMLNDLHRKKLFFFFKGSYEFGHDYPMRPKGKANQVMWAICTLMPTQEEQHKTEYHLHIQKLRIKYEKVFSKIPPGKPPDKGIEHIIQLEEGTKPIMITPYQHPK